ncbi:MAG: DapH/DapD/GlmU-related protein [Crocinitomicaceae bacterium]
MPTIKEIAESFNLQYTGDPGLELNFATSLDEQEIDALSWVKSDTYLSKIQKGCFLVSADWELTEKPNVAYLITSDFPRLVFSKILQRYFTPSIKEYLINEVEQHRLNPNIIIGDNVFIGKNVLIGDGTVVFPNVVIEANTQVGSNCVIKSHVSLGTEGLGLEMNPETELLEKFPQLGKVILEDHVDIGPTSTVRRGALKNTVIRRGTKIGSLVNIGHNCDIGENCILTCNIVTSGSSKIGDNVFIGVNSVVRNGVSIGANTTLGMGSVVTKTVPENVVAYGNPAKVIRKNE